MAFSSVVPNAVVRWRTLLLARVVVISPEERTVPVAIALVSGSNSYEVPWGALMAASVIVTVPLIALVVYFQRHIVAGLTAGSVKG